MVARLSIVPITLLFFFAANGNAQEPKNKLDSKPKENAADQFETRERKFLIYAIEDFYRSTFAIEDENQFLSSYSVRSFQAQHLFTIDKLRLHVQKKKMSPEYLAMCEDYRKLLAAVEVYAKKVEQREARYMKFLLDLRSKFLKEDAYRSLRARAESMRTALETSNRIGSGLFSTPGDMLIGGLFAGLTAQAAMDLELRVERDKALQAAKKRAAAYEQANRPALIRDIRGYKGEFSSEFRALRKGNISRARDAVASLVKKYDWPKKEVEFDPERSSGNWRKEDRPNDPFRIKQIIEEAATPKNLEDAEKCHANAKAALEAVDWVPIGAEKTTSDVYLHYRAVFCALAGRQALDAAAAHIGKTGFTGAKQSRPEAARTAIRAWERYMKYEQLTRDSRGAVLHCRVLALAYDGKLREAYTAASRATYTQSENAAFWYDAARIFSMNRDPKRGLASLKRAVSLGFKDFAEARATPDLEAVRKSNKKGFDQILKDN